MHPQSNVPNAARRFTVPMDLHSNVKGKWSKASTSVTRLEKVQQLMCHLEHSMNRIKGTYKEQKYYVDGRLLKIYFLIRPKKILLWTLAESPKIDENAKLPKYTWEILPLRLTRLGSVFEIQHCHSLFPTKARTKVK